PPKAQRADNIKANAEGGVMDYAFICEHFPTVEYLFGCYLPRFSPVVKTDADRIVRRFALNKPAALGSTVRDLERFLRFSARQADPEITCLALLALLECPHPIAFEFDACGWLQHVLTILKQYSQSMSYEGLDVSAKIGRAHV